LSQMIHSLFGTTLSDSLKFHHVGIAVNDVEKSRGIYEAMGYECSDVKDDPAQKVALVSCARSNEPLIELICPTADDAPCSRYLSVNGPGPYHVCYETSDIDNSIKAFANSSIRYKTVSNSPAKSVLFPDSVFMFIYVPDVGLVELIQSTGPDKKVRHPGGATRGTGGVINGR
jgi:methylmalonyl-CoA/ethylmalonyl-CoA epimerase